MNYPFDTVGLNSETIDSLDEIYKLIRSKFNTEITGDINFRLDDFEVFRSYQGIAVRGSYAIKQPGNNFYMLFVETHSLLAPIKGRISDCNEYQTWALAYLKKDFGRVMIRPETLTDKIIELIHPIELDFNEDKAFSDTFYVLVNDHLKAISAIDRNFRNVVMDMRHRDFVIEIINHTLIIGDRKPISPENAIYLGEFATRIASNC